MDDLITVPEAARRLGVNRHRVWALIHAGRIPAVKPGRDWLIRVGDLELVKDRKPGRPAIPKLTREEYEARGLQVIGWTKPPILRCRVCGESWRGWGWECPTGCNTAAGGGGQDREQGEGEE